MEMAYTKGFHKNGKNNSNLHHSTQYMIYVRRQHKVFLYKLDRLTDSLGRENWLANEIDPALPGR